MTPGSELVSFFEGGKNYWAQRHCQACGAWLASMPDGHHDVSSDSSGDRMFEYSWTCRACGRESVQRSSSPPDAWEGGPEKHLVGSVDTRDPNEWRDAASLTDAEKEFIQAAWAFLDATWPATYVHRAYRFMLLEMSLATQDLDGAVEAARKYIWDDEDPRASDRDGSSWMTVTSSRGIPDTPVEVWGPLLRHLRDCVVALGEPDSSSPT